MGMTNADDIQLKERVDLLPDLNEARPWKGSQEDPDEIFTDPGGDVKEF
jgi:hypothetical protein